MARSESTSQEAMIPRPLELARGVLLRTSVAEALGERRTESIAIAGVLLKSGKEVFDGDP